MDARGVLGFLVIMAIIILVCFWYSENRKEPGPKSEIVLKTDPKEDDEPKKENSVAKKGPDQITVYKYQKLASIKTCRFCDGENNLGDRYCRICGRQIDG